MLDNGEVLMDNNSVVNDNEEVAINNICGLDLHNNKTLFSESEKIRILLCLTIPPLKFDQVEINETQDPLKSWRLSEATRELLRGYGYNTIEHLEALVSTDIDEIFMKLDFSFFGERSLLKKRLFEWKEARVS